MIGGGDSACEEASFLTKYTEMVTLFVRGSKLRASKVMARRAEDNPKITIMYNTSAVEFIGDGSKDDTAAQKKLTGVKYKTMVQGNPTEREMNADGVFYAIGHIPNTQFLGGQVQTDEQGYVLTKPGTTETSVSGVFAAGDVQDKKWRQAITAAGTGCMAALSVEHYLAAQESNM